MLLFLSHVHTFPLQEQSLLADLSLLSSSQATAGQREAEKHTNKRQIYDQPDFCLQVRPRAVDKEKDSEGDETRFIPKALAPPSGRTWHTPGILQWPISTISSELVLNSEFMWYLLALICSWSLLYISRTDKQTHEKRNFTITMKIFF